MSRIFISRHRKTIEKRIREHINAQKDWLSSNTSNSTRAIGDGIESLISGSFAEIIGSDYCKSYSKDFARRAMPDLAFEDHDENYYVIDVKTHNLDTKFNMPNLTSVERLSRFYESDNNYFIVLMVSYKTNDLNVSVTDVKFIPIEYLGWDCLTMGALGWGQIQIANSNRITINEHSKRAEWMIDLCDNLLSFYPKEINKINDRIKHFEKIKTNWIKKCG